MGTRCGAGHSDQRPHAVHRANDMDNHKARQYVGTSAFVLALVSEWLDALQQVRSEQEKNDYAKKCVESVRVLQQLVHDIIENEPVNDASAPNQ
jgi:hypothetical protein